jgi:tRNA (cmo5U34)-methyltransferase
MARMENREAADQKHSVESHLQLDLQDYDRIIRQFIPDYDLMHRRTLEWLGALLPANASVLELGCGSGRFTAALLEGLPHARVETWDVDAKAIGLAKKRLEKYGGRVTFLEKSFHEPIPPCDAVVASLSLHHIKDKNRKRQVYGQIHRGLKPGGVFLSADAVVSEEPRLKEQSYERWAAHMGTQGISKKDAFKHFSDWAADDRYFSIYDELHLLQAAGFTRPECFFRGDAVAIFGGVKQV